MKPAPVVESASALRPGRAERIARRQDRLVELTRDISWLAKKELDDQDVRAILTAIVRRWSTTVPVEYMSEQVRAGARSHREHVVPVLVIVDRIIKAPRSASRILRTTVVVAMVTPEEHAALGPIRRGHPDLYDRMLTCRQDELLDLGWQRYRQRGVRVTDADGRTPWSR